MKFATFGLLLGAGVVATKWWENLIVSRFGRAGLREYRRSKPVRVVAAVATFHYICLAALFFPE